MSGNDQAHLRRHVSTAAGGARDGTLFAVANGAVGVRGVLDERQGGGPDTFLADAFETRLIAYHERFSGYADHTETRVSVPSAAGLTVRLDGAPVDFDGAVVESNRRELDFDRGVLDRTTRWRLPDGRRLQVQVLRCVPLDGRQVVGSRVRVSPLNFDARVALAFPLGPVRSVWRPGDEDDPRISARIVDGLETALASDGADRTGLVQRTRSSGRLIAAAQADADVERDLVGGQVLEADRFVGYAVSASADPESLLQTALDIARSAQDAGLDAMLRRQAETLAAFWANADVGLPGDPELEQATRFNLFHILQSTGRGEGACTAAKGLTGEGYEGHHFWDSEAFVLPVLAFTAPELARSILGYRYATLDAARLNARALDHPKGALFAWRTITGRECSAHYPTGSAQYHINAAVAFGVEQYEAATGDRAFMLREGAELLFETARIWPQVGRFNDRRDGAFTIHGVTGPDEYSAFADDNFYTNRMAQKHLRAAVRVARDLRRDAPEAYAALAERIGLTEDELRVWASAAERMRLPYDPALGVTPQDDGFLGKPRWDLDGTPHERRPLLLHHHPMTLFRHQVCKQGDVVQAMVMAGEDFPLARKRRDFDYYEPLTTHDSTLSASAHAVLAAEVGLEGKALSYHRLTALMDIEDRHGNVSHGVHMAAMAGSWLALAWGWGGLRTAEGRLSLAPACPAAWPEWRFRFNWRGSAVEAIVSPSTTRYRLLAGPPATFEHRGTPVVLRDQASVPTEPAFDAVIFDLDGVLTDTARAHYRAWKRLADTLGIPFDEADNERLKGVDRLGSLDLILAKGGRRVSDEERAELAERKNRWYLDEVAAFGPDDLFPGVRELLAGLRRARIRTGVASASRNAPLLLRRLGIADDFDFIADAAAVARSKPDPEIFLACAAGLGVAPGRCVAVEDSQSGLTAIVAAGMRPVAIGEPGVLAGAQLTAGRVGDLDVPSLIQPFEAPARTTAPA